jgi:hypothetical protein
MSAAAASVSSADHVVLDVGHQLPLHALARLVRRPRDLLERLVQG